VDSNFVAAGRIVLSLVVFAPFIRFRGVNARQFLTLAAIGAIQFGVMYVLYLKSFMWLKSTEVALFTIFTPLLVTFTNDLLERRISWLFFATATLAVVGTGIIQWTELNREGLLLGFVMMQLSNACFAVGQVVYRRVAPSMGLPDRQLMGTLYIGETIVAMGFAAASVNFGALPSLSPVQWIVLVYLGAIASGLGFFLFNAGARKVDVGALAIFNNIKVPLAILASVLIFREGVNWPRLIIGGAVIAAALVINESIVRSRRAA
jgi:drug/metabolite transporter (DMT)-like permease